MNAGYVRLSRDDDKRNYVSIENQKLIINQYASNNGMVIDRWYEDDGVSGYIFDRPGFRQMMADLDKDIDTVYVKDFSRLGRHNAKVLLLLDEFQERGKHLIVIDDNYDSFDSSDDTIGIKTWFNERYVKDTSKKIKRAIGARQKEGTLMTKPPFGYCRDTKDKSIIKIVPKEAEFIKMVYDLYISGSGYRKIANYLTDQDIPTPSMVQREREIEEGRISKKKVATIWSDSMVKELLDNDFYIGTFRLRKRARNTVHGKDKRVPKEEQCIFEDHHPAIIDKSTFSLVQELKEKRNRTNYRGSRGEWIGSEIPNPFGSCLFCKDCGSRLTPIKRQTSSRERKYYICTTYNTKGRRYCEKAHLIEENDLMEDVLNYIKLCREALCEVISTYDMRDFDAEKKTLAEKRQDIQEEIQNRRNQLKILLTQKIKDLSIASENEDLIHETYNSMQKDLLAQIHGMEIQEKELNETTIETPDVKDKLRNALDVVDKIIAGGTLDRRDIELLIERIDVDKEGMPEITLKYGLSDLINYSPADEMNRRENTVIALVMKLIIEDERGYTSAKYLSEHITALGFKKTKQSILPYINLMKELGILEDTDNPLKPYNIVKTKKEIMILMHQYLPDLPAQMTSKQLSDNYLHYYGGNRRYAGMVFEYILKENGIDPEKDLTIIQNIDFGSTAPAFADGRGDFTIEFEPGATSLESEGKGHVIASLGKDSGYVPYTAFSAKKSYLKENPDVIQRFTNALQKGMDYVRSHSPSETASVIKPQFPETTLEMITTIVTRYYEQDTWKSNLIFEESSFDLLQDILESAGELEKRAPYKDLITTEFAENAAK